ncbi:hypothetical protein GZH47_33625 (plasmid) [Paenibacillus rhizovicinus]|uniref:PD-(D/E)XK endonuclease-like domain-containing protein n=1 Tax=Paenibacillus rhizovicinus TaxID=2704463 RepID=A0A6C0PB77_9BACL|nr:hypothetical protein [Paenibacillus rhizovicinus]QHW35834.1 hypothetical protein GZH47_33625 [Paenibacillus rhizovicinus]
MGVLEPMIKSYYHESQKDGNRPMRGKLHPSTIGMCDRRIVFDMIMVPKEANDAQLMRIFDNGHGMHHRYEKMFEDMGILVQAEMRIELENISGHTDAWVKIRSFANPHGEDYLVELKSAFSKSFEWMVKNNLPKKEHRAQLTFYMHLTGIKKGIIFVENKDTQEVWEYELEYDPALGQQLMNKAHRLIEMAQQRRLPAIEKGYTPSNYKCAQCPYNIYCHAGATRQDGAVRYPIPFNMGSEIYQDVLRIIAAIQQGDPIPDVLEGSTNGDLVREVTRKNELVTQYTQRWNMECS